jgi:ATP-dependent RNA helicase DDX41
MIFRVPPFLSTIDDPRAAQGGTLKGCGVCGGMFFSGLPAAYTLTTLSTPGLGHGISNCPKLEDAKRREMASHRGLNDGGGGY